MSDDLIRDLADWLLAVQPYRDDLVLVGGVVPWLYRAWAKPQGQPLFTTDVDVACDNRLPVRDRSLRECLEGSFRTREIPGFDPRDAVAHRFEHRRHTERAPVYFELVTPLVGREREPPRTEVQAGTPASMLRYVDLLLREPLRIDVSELFGVEERRLVQAAHPAAFLVQKALLSDRPERARKRAGDLAHVVDVARLVLDRTDELTDWLERNATDATSKTWCRKANTILRRELGAPSADRTIEVARLFRDHEQDVDAELASAVVVELLDRLRLDRR